VLAILLDYEFLSLIHDSVLLIPAPAFSQTSLFRVEYAASAVQLDPADLMLNGSPPSAPLIFISRTGKCLIQKIKFVHVYCPLVSRCPVEDSGTERALEFSLWIQFSCVCLNFEVVKFPLFTENLLLRVV